MAKPKAPPTAAEIFLAPLHDFGAQYPELDCLIFWGGETWSPSPNEDIEAEETGFYAEGLMEEGFTLQWRLLAAAGEKTPDHARLYVWQEGEAPPPESADWQLIGQSLWPAKA